MKPNLRELFWKPHYHRSRPIQRISRITYLGYDATALRVYKIPHGNSHYVLYVMSLEVLLAQRIKYPAFCLQYSDLTCKP